MVGEGALEVLFAMVHGPLMDHDNRLSVVEKVSRYAACTEDR